MKKTDFIISILFIFLIIISKGDFAFSFIFLVYLSTFLYRYFSKKSTQNIFFKRLKILFKFGYSFFFISVFIFGTIIFRDININKNNIPKVSHIIVLGAGLKDNKPNELLEFRLIKAFEYYKKYSDTIFILSGGLGNNERISEAEAMKNYLIELGVPKNNLILEKNSTSTYENLKFSKEILKNLQVKNIGVLSSSFHLYRAKYIAKKLNLPIETIYAKTPYTAIFNYTFREMFAYFNEMRK